jgi:hypothetical protein
VTAIEILINADTESWRELEGCRMVGSDTMSGPLQMAGSIRVPGRLAMTWIRLEADGVVERDGVDVEDENKESRRGTHCFVSKRLVAVIWKTRRLTCLWLGYMRPSLVPCPGSYSQKYTPLRPAPGRLQGLSPCGSRHPKGRRSQITGHHGKRTFCRWTEHSLCKSIS